MLTIRRFESAMRVVSFTTIVAVTLGVFILSQSGSAQTYESSLTGTIRDSSGAVIPNVRITAENRGTGQQFSAVTDSTGVYTIPLLPMGSYAVTAKGVGFAEGTLTEITLELGEHGRADFTLKVGSTTQNVEVAGAGVGAPVDTQDAARGTVIGSKEIADLPLNGRDFIQLTQLAPGAVEGEDGVEDSAAGDERQPYTVTVNGVRGYMTRYTVDSVIAGEPWDSSPALVPPLDSVAEFNVQTNYSAEYGGAPGAQVNVATKNGTNAFHGTLYEFHRDRSLNTRNYFQNQTSPYIENQFGGSVGGPILKNKLFFFDNFESNRTRIGSDSTTVVPTVAERTGDFSALSKPILDPSNGFQPFPGNIIPQNRISNFASVVTPLWPTPDSSGAQNFVTSIVDPEDKWQNVARVDEYLTANDRLFGRVVVVHDNFVQSPFTPFNTLFEEHGPWRDTGVSVQETHVFGPNTLNELRVGLLYHHRFIYYLPGQFSQLAQELNIPGVTTNPAYVGFPVLNVTGFGQLAERPGAPQDAKTTIPEFADTLSLVRGKHQLSIGGDVQWDRLYISSPYLTRGSFSFDGRFTGNPYADLLLGLPASASRNIGTGVVNEAANISSVFFQDNFKVGSRLVLNLGTRYEFYGPWINMTGESANVNLSAYNATNPIPSVIFGAGQPQALYRPSKYNFAPRGGFAWDPTGRGTTSIRGGYGFYFAPQHGNMLNNLALNPPIVSGQTFVNSTAGNAPLFDITDPFSGPPVASTPTLYAVDQNWHVPRIQNYSVDIQHSLMSSALLIDAAYVGTKGNWLPILEPINDATPGAGPIAPRQPFPGLGTVNYYNPIGYSNYNALQVTARWNGRLGMTFLAAYTLSKATDLEDGDIYDNTTAIQNVHNLNAENGLAAFDTRQRFTFSDVWAVPVGHGRTFLNQSNRVVNGILGGWQVNGIFLAETGFPYTITVPGDPLNRGRGGVRPNLLSAPAAGCSFTQQIPQHYFNTCLYAAPGPFQFGDLGKNTLIGPGRWNLDLSLFKSFHFSESKMIEFRFEGFNAFNHPNFSAPGTVLGTPTFGTLTAASAPRIVQVAAKFIF